MDVWFKAVGLGCSGCTESSNVSKNSKANASRKSPAIFCDKL